MLIQSFALGFGRPSVEELSGQGISLYQGRASPFIKAGYLPLSRQGIPLDQARVSPFIKVGYLPLSRQGISVYHAGYLPLSRQGISFVFGRQSPFGHSRELNPCGFHAVDLKSTSLPARPNYLEWYGTFK
eukprot:6264284-Amphidinium_carterae.1